MALYHCPACDTTVDTDYNVCEEGPEGALWCERCITEYQQDQEILAKYSDEFDPGEAKEWFDYDPEC